MVMPVMARMKAVGGVEHWRRQHDGRQYNSGPFIGQIARTYLDNRIVFIYYTKHWQIWDSL